MSKGPGEIAPRGTSAIRRSNELSRQGKGYDAVRRATAALAAANQTYMRNRNRLPSRTKDIMDMGGGVTYEV